LYFVVVIAPTGIATTVAAEVVTVTVAVAVVAVIVVGASNS
jgi:hypothetical protein